MELLISIAMNAVLGVLLLALFLWKRRDDPVRLTGADDALAAFNRFYPDMDGIATVAADGRSALIDMHGAVGLLQRHGRRWNARLLVPQELARVRQDADGAINLVFADFGWPQAHIPLADGQARAQWMTRLEAVSLPHA